MSPEPTQEPLDNLSESTINIDTNINIEIANDSDSENDEAGVAGYMPLSQIPIEGEPFNDDEEDEV